MAAPLTRPSSEPETGRPTAAAADGNSHPHFRHPANRYRHDNRTSGQRLADAVTGVFGSWRFIVVQTIIVALWMTMMWVRRFYRDLFADTGGVPVPGQVSSGASINRPDVDLADPAWNTSGCPWYTMHYRDNYPHLQQIKLRWDPRDVFHHALSVRPTSSIGSGEISG
jgi:hypothetical protein